MIYRNENFAEENIDPNGHPATTQYDEWSEEMEEVKGLGCAKRKSESAKERRKRIEEMDGIVSQEIAETTGGRR